jgi:hypothetical protein
MKSNRFKVGAVITFIWLALIGLFLWRNWSDVLAMKPNELGDFFAGCFAPVAFFWLVLGYMQQGEELNANGKALVQQAEELKNSVEQQRQLVEATREQVKAERETLQAERVARRDAAKPRFEIMVTSLSFYDCLRTYDITIFNSGSRVTGVIGTLDGGGFNSHKLFEFEILQKEIGCQALFEVKKPFPDTPATLKISYTDIYDLPGECEFIVAWEGSGTMPSFHLSKN